jgi:hypothetical protein
MKSTLLLSICVLVGCGNDSGGKTIDAPGGGGDAAVTIDAPAKALTCSYYCSIIMSACTTAVAQYASMQNCIDTCAKFTPGVLDETMNNTLGCRIYHAEAAVAAPTTHCVHAGPTGGGMCGSATPNYCAVFCPLEDALCPGTYPATGNGRCLGTNGCPSIASNPPYSSNDTGKNDIECRFYHLTAAATAPTTHCAHTVVASSTCTQ